MTSARLPLPAAVISGVAPWASRASIFAPCSSSRLAWAAVPSVSALWIERSEWMSEAFGLGCGLSGRA